MARSRPKPSGTKLPNELRPLFWDHDFGCLTWDDDQDLVIGRVLSAGDLPAVRWLRSRLGDAGLREWLLRRQGAGLSPRQLRFWELILGLPHRQVNDWLRAPSRTSWDHRRHA
jgi:hypothetical protein